MSELILFGFAWFLVASGINMVWYDFLSRAEGLDVTVNDMLQVRALLFALPMFAAGWWQKSKCKPIYDRWVHQHGTNPDKWPDHCSGEFEAYSETPDGKILAKILETALIFLLLAVWGGALAGWPLGVPCAAAITVFNYRAQHLSKKAARTTAESLGRSLGRSLGWLLFGHPIVFWGLLIGALVALIYWWSVGAFG